MSEINYKEAREKYFNKYIYFKILLKCLLKFYSIIHDDKENNNMFYDIDKLNKYFENDRLIKIKNLKNCWWIRNQLAHEKEFDFIDEKVVKKIFNMNKKY